MYITVVVISVAAIYLLSGVIFAQMITHAHRQAIVHTPAAYGMDYEDVTFKSQDGLDLKGWFIPGNADKSIIITHPFPFNRHGFLKRNQGWLPLFKTDVDLLKTAQQIHAAGYNVLMFDFRNHGESQAGITGIGLNESLDVIGAVDYLKTRFSAVAHQIGFVSFCMGANSTLIAMSKLKADFKPVKCVVAIQPVSALVFVRSYLKATFTRLSLVLIPLVDRLVQGFGGYPLVEMSPLGYCADVQVPVLYIQGKHDPWTELEDIQSFYDATPNEKVLHLIEDKMRRFEVYNLIGEQPEKVLAFLGKYM
ncbi:MAG: hypothetical protein JXB38_05080 [Anaerolineales bacterium]|nr:hypothetical protein [Anaerolineales bacterium]